MTHVTVADIAARAVRELGAFVLAGRCVAEEATRGDIRDGRTDMPPFDAATGSFAYEWRD